MLIRNARLVLPDRIAEHGSLSIKDDRISRVISAAESVDDTPAIDLNGLSLFPGFIDIHIHGAAGIDTMTADARGLRQVGKFLAQNGVTAWLPTMVPAAIEQYQAAIQAIDRAVTESSSTSAEADDTAPARVLGVHYEGPFVNQEQCGALHREYFRAYTSPEKLDELPVIKHEAAIHMMTLAPEIEGGIALIKELTRRGWITSIGHTRAMVEVLDRALAAGAHHLTHFMNAKPQLHHRTLGPVGWGLLNVKINFDLIADGVHINPSVLKLIMGSKSIAGISLISDAIAATGMGDGEYEIWGEQIAVRNGRTQNTRGSIAGSVITMLEAVRLMSSLGVSEIDLARMASSNPANVLGIGRDYGSIAAGKKADLVALDENFTVQLTIIDGRIVYDAKSSNP